MTVHEELVAGRNLIADERRWIGRASDGKQAYAPDRYCVLGALGHVTGTGGFPVKAAARVLDGVAGESIESFNDSHSHAEVLAVFDKAIAATGPEPGTSFLTEPERATA